MGKAASSSVNSCSLMTIYADITSIAHAVWESARMAFAMFWEILWALILGFGLSAVVQAVVTKREMTKLLPDDSPKSIAIATALGAASSSCSYAAVALARSIFRKGANFTSAMAFQFASTNLVIELGIIMIVLMGWQFAAAEFVGGPIMIALLVILFKMFLRPQLVEAARRQAAKGVKGIMEGHAEMDMAVTEGPLLKRIVSKQGKTAISHYFVMDWHALWKDIGIGLLLAGALGALVPHRFWQSFFFTSHPLIAKFWGPLVGPLVAILSFVCSIGNVPLAAVLWNGGVSFCGGGCFFFSGLILLPVLNIYRKYYGFKVSAFLFLTFYAAMVAAALIVELLFDLLGLIPAARAAKIVEASITLNYTTILNIVFLMIATLLLIRFFRTGGVEMLRMMDSSGGRDHDDHHHEHHHHH